ncbi:MAG: hypothetical protein KJ950_14570 [Proteobacteria bacterium]|nr:hypothetical protein [Pseudomonadota bacterium]MBU1688992.1 hypothetical protein [Pseudomonadota bacterium]
MLANPQSRFLSPFFLFEIFFGVVRGIKLEIWAHLVVGMYGMYLVSSRLFRLSSLSALVPAVVFMLSGMYAFNLAAGQSNFMSIAYVPFVYYFFVKGIDDFRAALVAGLFFALMVFEGGSYTVPQTALFIAILSVLMAIDQRSFSPIKSIVICGISGGLLGAVKLLPALEFIRMVPRYTVSSEAMSPLLFGRAMIGRIQELSVSGVPGQAWGWEEYAHYVGLLPLLLAVVGSIVGLRKEWPLILTGLFFLVLAWGNFSEMSPWNILHQMPLFKSQRVPSRFMQYFVFAVALLAGVAVERIGQSSLFRNSVEKRTGRLAVLFVLILITVDLIGVNSKAFSVAFPFSPPEIHRQDSFRQVAGDEEAMYQGFLENFGTLDCYEEVHLPTMAIALDDGEYRTGEVYMPEGKAELSYWSPNKITVAVEGAGPIMLNQNYVKGWRTKEGKEVFANEGFIATNVDRDDSEITFYYLPRSVVVGAIISFMSLLSVLILFLKPRVKAGAGVNKEME